MMEKTAGRLLAVMGLAVALVAVAGLVMTSKLWAQAASSPNFSVDEVQFGSGSTPEVCWGSYCASAGTGALTVGEGASANYRAQFGAITGTEPMLEVIVTNNTSDVGVLETSSTATATADIQVRNYLSNGYVVQLTGSPPTTGAHTFAGMPSAAESTPGTEQFGVNVVDNATPDVGADPLQVPSSEFSFGVASIDYNTADYFKYVDGDIIAHSLTSSGRTDFTLSMILNISNLTPGGKYTSDLSAVVTPVF